SRKRMPSASRRTAGARSSRAAAKRTASRLSSRRTLSARQAEEVGVTTNGRIRKVTARAGSIPLQVPLRTALFEIRSVDTVFVEVETDQGLTGIGWLFAFGEARVKALKAMVDDLA